MRRLPKLVLLPAMAVCAASVLCAQDLAPRAYVITPLRSNAITLTYSFYAGNIDYNGALPVSGATGTYSVPTFSYYRSFSFFGRSANIVASVPYGVGNFQGTVFGAERHLYRSGLLDSVLRLSVNLKGGPAMPPQKFMKWKQKMLLGASLKVMGPTGQYNPTKLINWGSNRWSFKPEFGYSQRFRGNWVLDGYFGVWFYRTRRKGWNCSSCAGFRASATTTTAGSLSPTDTAIATRAWGTRPSPGCTVSASPTRRSCRGSITTPGLRRWAVPAPCTCGGRRREPGKPSAAPVPVARWASTPTARNPSRRSRPGSARSPTRYGR